VTLNSIRVIKIALSGTLTASGVKYLEWSVPFLLAGMLIGNLAHNKIDEKFFGKVVYIVLLVAGFFMFS
jgi:uncharacterized membrane protein YfcA